MKKLLLSCVSPFLSSMCMGFVVFYSAPAFPSLNAGHYGFSLTPQASSWLASFSGLFAIPGTLAIVPFMDTFGRKFAIIVTTLPMALGWLLIVLSYNVPTLAIGRALTGFSIGLQYSSIVVYLSEISPKQLRGTVCSFFAIFVYTGGVTANLLGSFIDWRWLALASLSSITLTSLFSIFMYETPRWLITHGHRQDAISVMSTLWSAEDPALIQTEIREIEDNYKLVSSVKLSTRLLALVKPPLWKPFGILLFLMVCQQFTGINYIASYSVNIYKLANANLNTSSPIFHNPNYQSCLTASGNLFGSILAFIFIDRLGRRILLMWSSVIIAVSLGAFGTYIYLQGSNPEVVNRYLFWLPLPCLMVYVIGFSFAYGTIPFLMASELIPMNVRSVANGIGMMVKNLCYFIVVKVFGSISTLPIYAVFWIYAGVAVVSLVFTFFCVPETKGRSLEEIQLQWYLKKQPRTADKMNIIKETNDL